MTKSDQCHRRRAGGGRATAGASLAVAVLLVAAGLVLVSSAATAQDSRRPRPEAAPKIEPVLEPKAMEILKAACDRLASARSMSFTAVATYESPSLVGPPLAYATRSEVALRRPDRLRIVVPGDGPVSEFYFDGKTMTAFAPAENLAATAAAPPSIDAALEAAYAASATYFPFTDLIVADPYAGITDGLTMAFHVGRSRVIGGTTTDIVAYGNDKVFVQAWIGTSDKLPRALRAVYRDDPAGLRHHLELSDWKLDLSMPDDAFASPAAAAAIRTEFARPDPMHPPAAAPARDTSKKKR